MAGTNAWILFYYPRFDNAQPEQSRSLIANPSPFLQGMPKCFGDVVSGDVPIRVPLKKEMLLTAVTVGDIRRRQLGMPCGQNYQHPVTQDGR